MAWTELTEGPLSVPLETARTERGHRVVPLEALNGGDDQALGGGCFVAESAQRLEDGVRFMFVVVNI